MKGVILMINPDAVIVDVSHEVPPQDIRKAAFFLMTACHFFPRGTVHVAVVDPGVGTKRKALLVHTTDGFFLGPDNGILSLALNGRKILKTIAIANRKYFLNKVSQTFHGRDIFSPVAAYVSRGVAPAEFGKVVKQIVRIKFPKPKLGKGIVKGEVIQCDAFGNLITNINATFLRGGNNMVIVAGSRKIIPVFKIKV
jgi:S-adenosylmethionine hydrolase